MAIKGLGYSVLEIGGERPVELDTFTCGHCQHSEHIIPGKRPEDMGGLCKVCMRLICGPCVDRCECDVLEKKLERMEARDAVLRSYGLG